MSATLFFILADGSGWGDVATWFGGCVTAAAALLAGGLVIWQIRSASKDARADLAQARSEMEQTRSQAARAVDEARDATKVQTAVQILAMRTTLQIEYSRQFGERWLEWATARKAFRDDPSNTTRAELRSQAGKFAAMLWGQVLYYKDGLFDRRRLTMYTRYRLWEFADLAALGAPGKEIADALIEASEGMSDPDFSEYMKSMRDAGTALHARVPAPKGKNGYGVLDHDTPDAKAVAAAMGKLDDELYKNYENANGHELSRLADALLKSM